MPHLWLAHLYGIVLKQLVTYNDTHWQFHKVAVAGKGHPLHTYIIQEWNPIL